MATEIPGLTAFQIGDRATLGLRWTKWMRGFGLYVVGKGITNDEQKMALLLHCAGPDVQDIFYTLTIPAPGEGENVYDIAKTALDNYFKPKVNTIYERSQFHGMCQNPDETVEQFVTRLRQKAAYCDFHNADECIRDQVIEKCCSNRLRRKVLERGEITLNDLCSLARSMESAESQAKVMEHHEEVNRLETKVKYAKPKPAKYDQNNSKKQKTCYACGYQGHIKKDERCPARKRQCNKCKHVGHFERMCKTQILPKHKRRDKVRSIEEHHSDNSDSEDTESLNYVFTVYDNEMSAITLNVGGVDISFIIDSGASVNVIDRQLWECLKKKKIKCKSRLCSKKLYAYGSKMPLSVAGSFEAQVIFQNKSLDAEFIVIEGSGKPLLGKKTAEMLGLLKIVKPEEDLNFISGSDYKGHLRRKFPRCFEGIGKLKDVKLTLAIDQTVKPVIQQSRRIPFHLREKLENKFNELVKMDIIEKVNEPSNWVSPVVVIPKSNGDIRLCVDMRSANEAIQRERYSIPTVDEILQDLNNSKVFSKLDLNSAYHQIELEQKSRVITTFMTHKGMYRYKRLNFGVNCAPELYNKLIHQVLEGCEGAHSIFDDIIIQGSSVEEHNERLEKVLKRLCEKGLTLNLEKCQIGLRKVEFMGHILSEKGIELSNEKIEGILSARAPQSVAEVRSFLGLVNFSSRFIPNLATIAEPMRKLTRKDEKFKWGQKQQDSFEKLKNEMARVCVLEYYDISCKTQVIADASPVGLGAVLVQEQGDEYRIISYASRSLTSVEKRYSLTEKEALALVWACERFRMYLQGSDSFELVTDHKPLEFIFSKRSKPCARVERWVLRLQSFPYKVKYIKGTNNIADSLSRLISENNKTNEYASTNKTEDYVYMVAKESTPVAMTTRDIEEASDRDTDLREIRQCLLHGKWEQLSNKEYLPIRHELSSIGSLVLRGTRILIPESLRTKVLELGHEGHPGIVLMKQHLRTKVWWPKMDKNIEQFCKSCHACQLVSKPSYPEPLQRTEMPLGPWQNLAIDFLGPLPSNDYLFVVVDYYSRWVEVMTTKSTTSEKVIELLNQIFCVHGLPVMITSDNGPQFISETIEKYMQEMGIIHHHTTPLYPQANGEVERQNRSLLKRLKIAQIEKKNWKEELQTYLMMYRSTSHSVTGISPAESLFGRKIRTKLPELSEYRGTDYEVRDRDSENKGKGKLYTDQRRKAVESDLKEGDKVLVKKNRENKLSANFHEEPMLVKEKNKNSVVVESKEGVQYRRNVTHLKKYHERNSEKSKENESEKISENENSEKYSVESRRNSFGGEKSSIEMEQTQQTEIPIQEEERSTEMTEMTRSRPTRERRMPQKFKDFVFY